MAVTPLSPAVLTGCLQSTLHHCFELVARGADVMHTKSMQPTRTPSSTQQNQSIASNAEDFGTWHTMTSRLSGGPFLVRGVLCDGALPALSLQDYADGAHG
jgi:hypothetical protein